MKQGIGIVLALLLVFSLSVSAFAVTENNSDILDEVDVQIYEKCSGHPFFFNYLVREDGWFAVYYRTSDKSNLDDGFLNWYTLTYSIPKENLCVKYRLIPEMLLF